jgi:predicted amidophosphoribosyltransferase
MLHEGKCPKCGADMAEDQTYCGVCATDLMEVYYDSNGEENVEE